MRTELFRKEAAEGLRPVLEGDVLALSPLSARMTLIAVSVLTVIAIGFSSIATYSKYVQVGGVVAPKNGIVDISAPTSGTLVQILVKEGDSVSSNQPLGRFETEKALLSGKSLAQEQYRVLDDRKRTNSAEWLAKLNSLQEEVRAQDQKTLALQEALLAAEATASSAKQAHVLALEQLARNQDLVSKGFVSKGALNSQEQSTLDRDFTYKQTTQTIANLKTDIATAKAAAAIARAQLRVSEASSQSSMASLSVDTVNLEASSGISLTAGIPGKVVAIPAKPGLTNQGTTLFSIAAEGPLYAHIVIPEAYSEKTKPGQKVIIRLISETDNQAKSFKGVIESISEGITTQGTGSNAQVGQIALVSLTASEKTLRPGARVVARIQTETKTLLEWLFFPVIKGFRQIEL